MSLTSFLSDVDNQDVRNWLKTRFIRPQFKIFGELKAPPQTSNYAVVGTAFDYLFRSYVKHYTPKGKVVTANWIADMGYMSLARRYERRKDTKKLEVISRRWNEAKTNFNLFESTSGVTDSLIESALFLAKLDLVYRIGYVDKDYDKYDQLDIDDIRGMLALIDADKFKVKKRCWLNPGFKASHLVGGADADIIIDDTLIDIKTTKHPKLIRDNLNQIICYYVFTLMGGVSGKVKLQPIENIGIYFARYGELWVTPISALGTPETFNEFKNWLHSYCREDGISYDDLQLLMLMIEANPKPPKKK